MIRSFKPPQTYALYHWLWSGLDLLFPPQCGGCGRAGVRWCANCAAQVQHPLAPLCNFCGVRIDRGHDTCNDCRDARPAYSVLRSWSIFEAPVRNAVHRLKYRRDIGLGEALTPQLSDFIASLHWPVEIVVPVPLGRKRLVERGYNQVSLIARPLSMAMRLPYAPDALARHHETRSQVGLSRSQRQQNVRRAFRARSGRVSGHTVLLVDDVATTGSTLSSCAEALYAAGARDVFAFTVSRAVPKHGLQNA